MRCFFLNSRYCLVAILWLVLALSNSLLSQEKKDTSGIVNRTENIQDTSTVQSVKSPTQDSTSKKNLAIKTPLALNADSIKNLFRSDSSNKNKLLKKLIPKTHGTISAGYDYGIIPFAANTNFPLGYYKSDGNISTDVLGLPINITYFYSSLKNIAGLNNYFRVSFDGNAYKEKLRSDNLKKLEEEKGKLTGLYNKKQLLEQKLAFAELNKSDFSSLQSPIPTLPNSSNINLPLDTGAVRNSISDSIQKNKTLLNGIPTANYISPDLLTQLDSITRVKKYKKTADSLNTTIDQYKSWLNTINQQIETINKKAKFYESQENILDNNPYIAKYQQLLSGVKKLDVGLCYPNNSTFLINGSTVKGVNLEWEKKLYFAFTYGNTINTIMTTNNIIQNQLQTGRNLYNFFDFNNVKNSRKIMALKFGVGKKDETHIHAGILFGIGLPSYLSSNAFTNSVEKNIVLELDGKYVINASNSFDLVFGKSVLYQNGIPENPEVNPSQTLFSSFRTNAALVRYNMKIEKTNTKVTVMGRMIDPFFQSYGAGYMKSDNLRYEFRIEQPINDRIKFSGFYRRDRDNLLNSFLYTTSLQTIGSNLTIKINKRLTARLMYSPVIQKVNSKDNSYTLNNVNNISNGVLTYTPRFKKITSSFHALYSYYQLSDGKKNNNFQNFSFNNTTIFNPFIRINMGVNQFVSNAGDSLNNNTTMLTGDVSISTKQGATLTLGAKCAYNNVIQRQIGGLLRINIPLIKHMNIEFEAQKLVLGDFYSSFYQSQMKKFPYYGYGKIIFTW